MGLRGGDGCPNLVGEMGRFGFGNVLVGNNTVANGFVAVVCLGHHPRFLADSRGGIFGFGMATNDWQTQKRRL